MWEEGWRNYPAQILSLPPDTSTRHLHAGCNWAGCVLWLLPQHSGSPVLAKSQTSAQRPCLFQGKDVLPGLTWSFFSRSAGPFFLFPGIQCIVPSLGLGSCCSLHMGILALLPQRKSPSLYPSKPPLGSLSVTLSFVPSRHNQNHL